MEKKTIDLTLPEMPLSKQRWQRNATLFILSQAITLFGSSLVQMAIIWQVALETSSGVWVTLLTLSSTVPQTVLSFFAGVWADRYPRKRLIIAADAGIAVVTMLLALVFLTGGAVAQNLLLLIVLVSALRSVGAGIQTPAVSAAIAQIVPEESLMRYNGINGSIMSIVQFAAPAAAGAILYLGPFHWILLIDVITAVIGIAILLRVVIAPQERELPVVPTVVLTVEEGFFAEMKAGVTYAVKDRVVSRVLFTFGAFIFLCVPSGFLTVLMIERTFGSSYMFLTVAEMAGFAGMVLGGLALGVWGGFTERRRTLLLGLVGYGLFSLAIGFADLFWLFALLLFLSSFFIPVVQSAVMTMLQEYVPEEKQGRVFGLLSAMYSGGMPLGMLVFGPLADVVKIQVLVVVCGAMILVLAVWGLGFAGIKTKQAGA